MKMALEFPGCTRCNGSDLFKVMGKPKVNRLSLQIDYLSDWSARRAPQVFSRRPYLSQIFVRVHR